MSFPRHPHRAARPQRKSEPLAACHDALQQELLVEHHQVGVQTGRDRAALARPGPAAAPGVVAAAAAATLDRQPDSRTARRTASSIVSVLPASRCRAKRGCPSRTTTSDHRGCTCRRRPRRADRVGDRARSRPGADRAASRTSASCTCTPSLIISTATPASSAATDGPGARWLTDPIALNRWVARRRPGRERGRRPARTSRRCARPRPPRRRATMSAISSSAPGSSGASVTVRTAPWPASSNLASTSGSGASRWAGFCAPHRAVARNGPSRCAPSTRRPRCASGGHPARVARTDRRRVRPSSDTSVRVVPCARWNATPRACRRLSGEVVATPAVHVQVDEAGHAASRRPDRPPARADRPAPTRDEAPAVDLHPAPFEHPVRGHDPGTGQTVVTPIASF